MKISLNVFEADVLATTLAGEITTCIERGRAAELPDESRMVMAAKQNACEGILSKLEKARRRAAKQSGKAAG